MTDETYYESTAHRLAEARAQLAETYEFAAKVTAAADSIGYGLSGEGHRRAVEQDVLEVEGHIIDEHRDAADSGFLGAYPMPEVASVDDWWRSGLRFDAHIPAATANDEDGWF